MDASTGTRPVNAAEAWHALSPDEVVKRKGQDDPGALARTVAVNAITIGQCFRLLNSRYPIDSSVSIAAHLENKCLSMGIGAVVALQLMFTHLPPLQHVFDTEPVPLYVWAWLLGCGLLFLFFVEAEKLVIRLRRDSSASTSAGDRRPAVRHDCATLVNYQ